MACRTAESARYAVHSQSAPHAGHGAVNGTIPDVHHGSDNGTGASMKTRNVRHRQVRRWHYRYDGRPGYRDLGMGAHIWAYRQMHGLHGRGVTLTRADGRARLERLLRP